MMNSTLFYCSVLLAISTVRAQVTATDQVRNPYGLVIGPNKALYICEIDAHRVSRLDLKTHQLTSAAEGGLQQPYEVRFDRKGNMFFVDMPAHKVYRVDAKTRKMATRTVTGAQFLWLVLQHVLPKGFRRARNYGFLHPNCKRLIALLHVLLKYLPVPVKAILRVRPPIACPCCGAAMKIVRTRLKHPPPTTATSAAVM